MNVTKIACIGSGNMGFALMKGIAALGSGTANTGTSIGFTDVDAEKAASAAAALEAEVYRSNAEASEKADFIFLAVKPQVLSEVLKEIAPVILKRLSAGGAPLLVSMAAGWTIEKIQASIANSSSALMSSVKIPLTKIPVTRIMPNTPALISKGMIALAVSPEVPGDKAASLEAMLKGAGMVDRVSENYFNAITGLSGSGPAFAFLFTEALADGGVLAGLPRDKSLCYAAQTVLGSAAMILETGKHPGELKDMVASPGGTTIAGVAALESGSFRSAAIQAVQAAWKRAKELQGE
jgi:pyrroline-5-carboxylate reductase